MVNQGLTKNSTGIRYFQCRYCDQVLTSSQGLGGLQCKHMPQGTQKRGEPYQKIFCQSTKILIFTVCWENVNPLPPCYPVRQAFTILVQREILAIHDLLFTNHNEPHCCRYQHLHMHLHRIHFLLMQIVLSILLSIWESTLIWMLDCPQHMISLPSSSNRSSSVTKDFMREQDNEDQEVE